MSHLKIKKLMIRTDNGNDYLINRTIPQVILLHPILNYLLKRFDDGDSISRWLEGLPEDETVQIETDLAVSKHELRRNFDYYRLLETSGYFNEAQKIDLPDSTYTSEMVEFHLANTRQIVLEVCDTCGLDCKYCGYGDLYGGNDKREGKRMNPETAKTLLDYIIDLQTSSLNRNPHKELALSFYGGEPTDNMPLIREMVQYALDKNLYQKPIIFAMTTNALNLDKHMDFLAQHRFLLLISLDGDFSNNSYRTTHGGKSSFKRVYDNILKLKNKHPDYFKHFVNFNAVIHNRNSRKEVEVFFKDHFGKMPQMNGLSAAGIKPEKQAEFDKMFRATYEGLQQEDMYNYFKDKETFSQSPLTNVLYFFLRSYSGFVFKYYDTLLQRKEVVRRVMPGTCMPFERKVFLTVNGKILPCERILQKYGLGNVDETGVHLDPQSIADTFNRYLQKLKEQCNRCFRIDNCPTCIFMLNLDAATPSCDDFMDDDAFKRRLQECMTHLEQIPHFYSRVMSELVRY